MSHVTFGKFSGRDTRTLSGGRADIYLNGVLVGGIDSALAAERPSLLSPYVYRVASYEVWFRDDAQVRQEDDFKVFQTHTARGRAIVTAADALREAKAHARKVLGDTSRR